MFVPSREDKWVIVKHMHDTYQPSIVDILKTIFEENCFIVHGKKMVNCWKTYDGDADKVKKKESNCFYSSLAGRRTIQASFNESRQTSCVA